MCSITLQLLEAPLCLQYIWVVVKIRVPFGVPIIIRHLIFRVPQKIYYFLSHLGFRVEGLGFF